jgi:hypothetical protein
MEQVDELIIQLKRLLPPGDNAAFAKPPSRKLLVNVCKVLEEAKKVSVERDALLTTMMRAWSDEETQP